ncbi:non-specific serine,threonine protein kinase [Sarracenia purpurea var. burkii]
MPKLPEWSRRDFSGRSLENVVLKTQPNLGKSDISSLGSGACSFSDDSLTLNLTWVLLWRDLWVQLQSGPLGFSPCRTSHRFLMPTTCRSNLPQVPQNGNFFNLLALPRQEAIRLPAEVLNSSETMTKILLW